MENGKEREGDGSDRFFFSLMSLDLETSFTVLKANI